MSLKSGRQLVEVVSILGQLMIVWLVQMIRAWRQKRTMERLTASFTTRRSPFSTASAASHWTQSRQDEDVAPTLTRVASTQRHLATLCFEEAGEEVVVAMATVEGTAGVAMALDPAKARMGREMAAGCTAVDLLSVAPMVDV